LLAAEELIPCLLPDNELRFGRYSLLYRFAAGGMANLYAAKLTGTDGFSKTVAIKMMHSHLASDPEFVKMFIDEARLASRISHPNVVQTLELGRVKQTHYIAMEYVEGESVRALLQRARPPIPCGVQIAIDVASGLHAAHELRDAQGLPLDVVHRDVSPDNILISYDGAVKIVDFGVARARDSLHSTSAGSLKGKFSYMAPEQATAAPVDRRVDVFALGIVLYELTTCRRLFRRPTDAETIQAVIAADVPPPSSRVEGYPEELERIVMTALSRRPDGRFRTTLELQAALEGYLVRSGDLPAPSALGRMMREVFADRINRRQEIRLSFSGVNQAIVPDVVMEVDPSAEGAIPTLATPLRALRRGSGTAPVAPPPRRWPSMIALCLIGLMIGAGGGLLWLQRRAPREQGPVQTEKAQASRRRPLQRVVIRSEGQTGVKAPADAPAPAGAVGAAAGAAVAAEQLRPSVSSKPAKRRRNRAPKRRRRRQRRLADRDVLKNPYRR